MQRAKAHASQFQTYQIVEQGRKNMTRKKKNGGESFFLLVFPAYDLTFSPPSEHCALLSECLELPTSKVMQLKMKKKSELPAGEQTVQDHSA